MRTLPVALGLLLAAHTAHGRAYPPPRSVLNSYAVGSTIWQNNNPTTDAYVTLATFGNLAGSTVSQTFNRDGFYEVSAASGLYDVQYLIIPPGGTIEGVTGTRSDGVHVNQSAWGVNYLASNPPTGSITITNGQTAIPAGEAVDLQYLAHDDDKDIKTVVVEIRTRDGLEFSAWSELYRHEPANPVTDFTQTVTTTAPGDCSAFQYRMTVTDVTGNQARFFSDIQDAQQNRPPSVGNVTLETTPLYNSASSAVRFDVGDPDDNLDRVELEYEATTADNTTSSGTLPAPSVASAGGTYTVSIGDSVFAGYAPGTRVRFHVVAFDTDGETTAQPSGAYTIVNRSPQVSSINCQSSALWNDQTHTFVVTVTDPDGNLKLLDLAYTIQDADGTVSSYGWSPRSVGGVNDALNYSATRMQVHAPGSIVKMTAKVTDTSGATESLTRTYTIPNRAPSTTNDEATADTAYYGSNKTLTVTGTDPDGNLRYAEWQSKVDSGAWSDSHFLAEYSRDTLRRDELSDDLQLEFGEAPGTVKQYRVRHVDWSGATSSWVTADWTQILALSPRHTPATVTVQSVPKAGLEDWFTPSDPVDIDVTIEEEYQQGE